MGKRTHPEIVIKGARTNNLKNISLNIPHNKFVVVTGVSGSGKSSLVFEVIAKEGQRRYFETLPSFARQFMGKLNRPDTDDIEGLSPVIAIGQRTTGVHARSTVGTLSDIYDLLRLLFARTGTSARDIEPTRALFSFNSAVGKCARCNGIGQEEKIDLNKLIIYPKKSIREGALAPTLPNGYIMYSQVTIDVLNQVCEAEGFNVDIPWNELSERQQNVILYGSNKIKVPFGKHSLESRLKWTGIKAKPREEGHYKGMIPIMSDILHRDRNANILKYVHAVTCQDCLGTRLNDDALSFVVHNKSMADVVRFEFNELKSWIESNDWGVVSKTIIQKIESQIDLLIDLGLGHLHLDRPSKTLRASEIQRIRLANQMLVPLSDVLYVFDEPSIGLHSSENQRLVYHFKRLVEKGNTVVVVEHDLETIKSADHIIEIGPGAGTNGGEVIYNGSFNAFENDASLYAISPTYNALNNNVDYQVNIGDKDNDSIRLIGCQERNLKNIDVTFQLGKLNVVSGKSGVGKSSLVKETLLKLVQQYLGIDNHPSIKISKAENLDKINKLIFIDHSPIGKTPRSNPATYLGIADYIRDIFAKLPISKSKGLTKSRFSFNNKGGRCETCKGAGKTQIGMHFLGNIDLLCGECNGDRFNEEILEIKYKGKSIADIYKLTIDEAVHFFEEDKKVLVGLSVLQEIGLGYLSLGQSSTTLSGGEAQRIKIANQLQKKDTGNTLYIIIEPSIGLHYNDIASLLLMFERIKKDGNTIACIEQDESIINASDWHIELGPESGKAGGEIVYQGMPLLIEKTKMTSAREKWVVSNNPTNEIILSGVKTNGLKNINARIPKQALTVVTGLSGSGKSSLVYDTLFEESNARFTESLSTYNRSFLKENSQAVLDSFSGLGPAIGINRRGGSPSKRSTVGTLSGIYDAFRLLYSRIAQHEGRSFSAQHFSFNHHLGACPACEGLGLKKTCDKNKIVVDVHKSIYEGAISGNKAIAFYADGYGQFIATLKEVAKQKSWNLDMPWKELDEKIKHAVLYGTGDLEWNVTWEFATKSRKGTQVLSAKWLGFCEYINEEYGRRLHNKNIKHLEDLLHEVTCSDCNGSRLKPALLKTQFQNKNIHELSQLSIESCYELLQKIDIQEDNTIEAIGHIVLPSVLRSLKTIIDLGLGYLNLDRTVDSLSGGERQRVTLVGQLAAQLFGVIYILDEPTIGLDENQVGVLFELLRGIVNKGNTVVVVEHDPFFIKQADYLIEMGPGAGRKGGEIIFQGKVADIQNIESSVTYKMIYQIDRAIDKVINKKGKPFGIKGANANNLKNIDVEFYSGQIIAVKGVSGSGKSSLINDVLYSSSRLGHPVDCQSIYGLEQFEEVLLIDQEMLGQNRLSSVATITGMMDYFKHAFANVDTAKESGLKKTDFSYQSKKGKCSSCAGYGQVKVSMDFMSDIWLVCDRCHGLRYDKSILEITLKGLSIGEVLNLTIDEALNFFESVKLVEALDILRRVGVGHLKLGQSSTTLSGGEAQRVKLATAMLQKKSGPRLFLFDEPSTGLHYFDILPLLEVFQSLIDLGDTVLFIEHNKLMIDSADQLVVLGPGSGAQGGEIVD